MVGARNVQTPQRSVCQNTVKATGDRWCHKLSNFEKELLATRKREAIRQCKVMQELINVIRGDRRNTQMDCGYI